MSLSLSFAKAMLANDMVVDDTLDNGKAGRWLCSVKKLYGLSHRQGAPSLQQDIK